MLMFLFGSLFLAVQNSNSTWSFLQGQGVNQISRMAQMKRKYNHMQQFISA